MKRAIIVVLDSLGVGSAPDSAKYNDEGSNTLGHIAESTSLSIPHLTSLGLVAALKKASGNSFGLVDVPTHQGGYAVAQEISTGKDTVSGHWEMAGCPVLTDWGYFTQLQNSFPKELIDSILQRAGLSSSLANCHASGTQVLDDYGETHIKTGHPIFYTSADSVFQIAAHETHFGLDKLYQLCEIARQETDKYNVCRVIARPFVGEKRGEFQRTYNRKDYAVPPLSETVLDKAYNQGIKVVAIGKTGDIFAHRGIHDYLKTPWNEGNIDDIITALNKYKTDALIFANLADFDVLYGHRRNPQGYASAIEYFDSRLPEIIQHLEEEDLLIITADHGNDPTWHGTDHTREYIPILVYNKKGKVLGDLGVRQSFCDIAQTVAQYLSLPPLNNGISLIN